MTNINWDRVSLGGLLAGVIINVFEIVRSGIVLGKQWQAAAPVQWTIAGMVIGRVAPNGQ